jgi:hypothetical protein
MTQAQKYRNLASNARYCASKAKTEEEATYHRAEAIRYERLASLAALGKVEEK